MMMVELEKIELEDAVKIFGFDPTTIGLRHRSWWTVQSVEEEEAAAGAEVGDLCVKARDGGDNPLDYGAIHQSNFRGTAEDGFDRTYRYYYFKPLTNKEDKMASKKSSAAKAKKKKGKEDITRSETFKEDMLCELTGDEVAEAGISLARHLAERASLERQKAEAVKGFKNKIDAHDSEIEGFSKAINSGETREVDCVWEFNWTEGKKVLIRLDIDEEALQTDITTTDRQMHMRMDGQDPAGGEEDDGIAAAEAEESAAPAG